jgi:hypothetical protein
MLVALIFLSWHHHSMRILLMEVLVKNKGQYSIGIYQILEEAKRKLASKYLFQGIIIKTIIEK